MKDDKLLLNKDEEISETNKEKSINKDDNKKIKEVKISSEENKEEKNEINEHEEKKHKHEHKHEQKHSHDRSKSKGTSKELINKSKDKDYEKDKSNSKNKKGNDKSDKSNLYDNKKISFNIKKDDKTLPKTNKIPLNKKKESNDSSHNNVNKKETKYPIDNYDNYQKKRKYTFAAGKKLVKGITNTLNSKKNINDYKNNKTKNNPISLRTEEPTKGLNKEIYSKSTRNITSFYNYNEENKVKKKDKNLKVFSDKKLLNKTTIFNHSKVNINKEEKEKEKIPKTTINRFPYLGSKSNKNVTFLQYKNDSKNLNKQDKNIKEKKNKKDMFSKEIDEKKKMNKTFIK